jgi:hypothetical protein
MSKFAACLAVMAVLWVRHVSDISKQEIYAGERDSSFLVRKQKKIRAIQKHQEGYLFYVIVMPCGWRERRGSRPRNHAGKPRETS